MAALFTPCSAIREVAPKSSALFLELTVIPGRNLSFRKVFLLKIWWQLLSVSGDCQLHGASLTLPACSSGISFYIIFPLNFCHAPPSFEPNSEAIAFTYMFCLFQGMLTL
jgi:hypothetical protein